MSNSSFIMECFQEFYEEVLRQKEKALRESEGETVKLLLEDTTEAEEESEELPPEEDLSGEELEGETPSQLEQKSFKKETSETNLVLSQNIQRKLRLFLEEKMLQASYQLGHHAQGNFKEAEYAMAALADEVFLNLHWPGVQQWKKHLLETQLFHTQIAGEQFFVRLESLLQEHDPARNDLAMLYLLCLSLGFRGKYRGMDDEGKLNLYKKKLYYLAHHKESDLYDPGRKYLVHAAYEHNSTLPQSKGLPDVRTWVMTFAGIGVFYLFVTYILWYGVVRDVDEAIQLIFEQARSLPL